MSIRPPHAPSKTHARVVAVVFVAGAIGLFSLVRTAAFETTVRAADELRLYMRPSTTSIYPGETLRVQLRLSHSLSQRVNYVNAQVKFNSSVFEVASVSRSGSAFTQNGGPEVLHSNRLGMVYVSGQSNSYLPSPSDSLVATVTFKAKATDTASFVYTNDSEVGETIGASGKTRNYLTAKTGTTVRVVSRPAIAPSPTPAPAPAQSPAPTPAPTPTPLPTKPKEESEKPEQPKDEAAPKEDRVSEPTGAKEDSAPEAVPVGSTEDDTPPSQNDSLPGLLMAMIGSIGLIAVIIGGAWLRQRFRGSMFGISSGGLSSSQRHHRNIHALAGTAIYATVNGVGSETGQVLPPVSASDVDEVQTIESMQDIAAIENLQVEEAVTQDSIPGYGDSETEDTFDRVGQRFAQLAPSAAATSTAITSRGSAIKKQPHRYDGVSHSRSATRRRFVVPSRPSPQK